MYAYFNQYSVRKLYGIQLLRGLINKYKFNSDSIRVINDSGIVEILDKDLFIDDSIEFVKDNGCFPSYLSEFIDESFISKVNVGDNDIIWHKVLIEDDGVNLSRAYLYVDSKIYQRNGKQIMNSTLIDRSLLNKRCNDVRIVRAIENGLHGNTGKIKDLSLSVCDYLEDVNISNVCYILDIDRHNKLNIVYANGTVYFLVERSDYVKFSNVIIDMINSNCDYNSGVRQLAFCRSSLLEAGKYRINDIEFNIKKMSEIYNLIRYIMKNYNKPIEIVRSDL